MHETEHLLDLNTLLARFGATDTRDRVLRRLHALISRRGPFDDGGIGWVEDLGDWVCERGRIASRRPDEREEHARLRALADALEELPSFRAALSEVVQGLMNTSSTQLFTGAGLAMHGGFWGELVDRIVRRVLPEPPVENQLLRVLARTFGRHELAHAWVSLDAVVRGRIATALDVSRADFSVGLREAEHVLATRIAALGMADDVQALVGGGVGASPFLSLGELVRVGDVMAIDAALEECTRFLLIARAGLDARGVSVDLVFRLDQIAALVRRLRLVVTVAEPGSASALERELVLGVAEDRSLLAVGRAGTKLLARRVVERAGHSGEHYVTRTRLEQRAMLAAAAGGGALTAFAVASKFFIAHVGFPPLFLALAIGLNYAVAFVLMQAFHFSLATKQPSMTAATIAGAIEASQATGVPDLEPIVDLVARASRTQSAALVGNVVVVVPLAVLIDLFSFVTSGEHLLDHAVAERIVAVHHPLLSGTLPFAAATGVWLWVASLLAGAVENWFILREFPGALAESRVLRRLIGPARAARLGAGARAHLSGVGGNVGLGMLLGFMPMLFSLVGVPLDVRHVTFVTGQLVFSVMELGPMALSRGDVLISLLAIPLVGLTNFAVSFLLAIFVALRSRDLGAGWLLRLFRAVLRRFKRRPTSFFVAPREDPPSSP